MIEQVRSGRSPEDLAKEFEPSGQTIRNWVQQADQNDGLRHDGLSSQEWAYSNSGAVKRAHVASRVVVTKLVARRTRAKIAVSSALAAARPTNIPSLESGTQDKGPANELSALTGCLGFKTIN